MIEHHHRCKNILDKDAEILANKTVELSIYTKEENNLIDEIMDTAYVILELVRCPQ